MSSFWKKATNTLFGQDYSKKDKSAIDSVWGPAQGQIASLYGGAYANQQKGLQSIKQGFAGADAAVVKGGAVAARSIADQYRQGAAADNTSAVSRGLQSTGSLDANRRGMRIDRARSLSELDAQIAQMRAQIQSGQGQAMAQGYGQLAGTQLGYQGMLAQIAAQRSGQYAGLQYGRQGGLLAGIAPIAGAVAGAAAGNPMAAASLAQPSGDPGNFPGYKKKL